MRRTRISLLLVLGMLAALLPMGATPVLAVDPGDPMINEFVFSHDGKDLNEYVEVLSEPGADLSDFAVVEVEGDWTDTGATGLIDDGTVVLGTADGSGYWWTGFQDNVWENGSATLLLVEGFTGTVGEDLDTDDDGALDVMPWERIVDGVAVDDGGATDLTYASVVLFDGFDGLPYTPGGASRIPNGTDTDTVADWMRNDFDLAGLPGILGTPIVGEALNTPGAENDVVAPPVPDVVVNEVDADTPSFDALEFVELFDGGVGSEGLDGLSVVLFNGSDDSAYSVFDLDGYSTDADGYFVIGSVPGADIAVDPGSQGWLQNGADAVAVYAGDFANGSVVSTTDLVDAIVYDTNDGDDAGLLVLLNPGQPQVNEDGGGDKDNHSNQRCPNGSGAARDTDTYTQAIPTPGAANCVVPPVIPELVINEIVQDPDAVSDANGEWFEIYNAGAADVDIDGWTAEDNGSDIHVIDNGGPLVVPADGYLVLGRNGDPLANGGVTVDYEYGSDITLANGDDEVVLLDTDLNEVDRVEYDGGPVFPDPTGASMALSDPALDNNVGANWCQSGTAFGDGDLGSPGAANDCAPPPGEACSDPATFISAIQGSGATSPEVGIVHSVEAVIVADQPGLGGFYVQEEAADVDGDPATSEGIFVYMGGGYSSPGPIGDLVRVKGEVGEYTTSSGSTFQTQIYDPSIRGCGAATPIDATDVNLPISALDEFERYEGMLVRFPQSLAVSDYWNFDRFNETVLALPFDGQDRPFQGTAVAEPGAPSQAVTDLNALSRIMLDDGRTSQNSDPAIHPNGSDFDLSNLFRGGDTAANATGVIDNTFGIYRIQPTIWPEYDSTNARPIAPDDVDGTMTVAAFNVLNYFTTFGSRGAEDQFEFTRQRDKIFAALSTIDADVVGLIEIENNGPVATGDLVNGLNAVVGAGTYDFINTGVVGDDAITVALIYKPDSVSPIGAFQVLDDASFTDPNNLGESKNRPALAQTFAENASGEVFTVVVNHLKSKGSGCGIGDDDPQQGSCNDTRTKAAQVLVDWLAGDPTGSSDSDFLIIGDLNAYDEEDPIDAVRGGADDALGTGDDYTDLVKLFGGELAYSYLFGAQFGYLDHALANRSVARHVSGTTVWHINADEPDILDYNTNFRTQNQINNLYQPDAYRSSDHDPVIVGLDFSPRALKHVAIDDLEALLPTGNRYYDKRITKAIGSIEDSLNPMYWVDDFHLTDKGNKVFDEEKKAVKDLMRVHGSIEPEVDGVIATLVEVDDRLATAAIDDAVAAGGSQRYIDKALKEMEEAQKDLDRNKPDKAIDHYKKAWQHAQRALAEAPARFATFNASLNRFSAGGLAAELSTPGSAQPATIAEIVQRNRPDVILINEFDYDAGGVAAERFQNNYLSIPQNGAAPIVYPYRYVAPSNTGVPSGFDLDNNGSIGGPNDAFGFGFFEGQFAFVVYSMYPIDAENVRTFQNFLWKDMPGALLPEDEDGAPWFTDEELDVVRLSSKNHVDVPISVGGEIVHFLVSHPTPPVFDGPEDRNGKRNYDEIRFWADYVGGGNSGKYIYDDAGKKGGLSNNALFVIAGDQNADPFDGDSYPGAAQLLLDHPRTNDKMTPSSLGGTEQDGLQVGINDDHLGDPAFDTADFSDSAPGNLRVDYVLPRKNMKIMASGVFWPETTDPLFPLVGTFPFPSSDHRLVWIDLDL